jgi:DNA repair exonuclease SbcCD ATPase subunit
MEAKQAEVEARLMEIEAQNDAMAKSLQERARKIREAQEGRAMAEKEAKLLEAKLGSAEKEMASLRYELHVASKELEIRIEEAESAKKSADSAHRQHLDRVKKMANLEADCARLRNLVRKKLPGPAAIAQMRKEVDGDHLHHHLQAQRGAPRLAAPLRQDCEQALPRGRCHGFSAKHYYYYYYYYYYSSSILPIDGADRGKFRVRVRVWAYYSHQG